MSLKVLFSDLDGTCIHYDYTKFLVGPDIDAFYHLSCGDIHDKIIRLPPSTSGAEGIISLETLRLYQAIRAKGVKLVLVTGARFSTVMQRLPYLPDADAILCESGGRIFYPDASSPTVAKLREDMSWRGLHTCSAGPIGQDALPPDRRTGALWTVYASLLGEKDGVLLDAANYTTAFRVKGKPEVLETVQLRIPPNLSTSQNLGAADIYPKTSGKRNAAQYIIDAWGVKFNECGFMCDDDNDVELAQEVFRVYMPTITAASIGKIAAQQRDKFTVSRKEGVYATEYILLTILSTL